MSRKHLPKYIILLVLALMAISNPGEQHFKKFVKGQLTRHKFSETEIESSFVLTKSSDYFFFSEYAYQVNDYGVPVVNKYIGVFGIFIQAPTSNNSQ